MPVEADQRPQLPGLGTANFQKKSRDCTMLSFNEKDKLRDYDVGCQTLDRRLRNSC
jgi:hypothetical protein